MRAVAAAALVCQLGSVGGQDMGRVQHLQEDLAREIGGLVQAKLQEFMRLPFYPIDSSFAQTDSGFLNLTMPESVAFRAAGKDQMLFTQMISTGQKLDMIYAGMETGEFFGYFSSLGATYRAAGDSPPAAMNWEPWVYATGCTDPETCLDVALEESSTDAEACAAWSATSGSQQTCEDIMTVSTLDGTNTSACSYKLATDCKPVRCSYASSTARARGLRVCVGSEGANNSCVNNDVRNYYNTETKTGVYTTFSGRTIQYDPRERTWYVNALEQYTATETRKAWSSIYTYSDGDLGITATGILLDPTDTSVPPAVQGVLGNDYKLATMQTFLSTEFTHMDLIAYIVERGTGHLLASSVSAQLEIDTCAEALIIARNSTNSVIAGTAALLDDNGTFTGEMDQEVSTTLGSQDILANRFQDGLGLDWVIVITQQIECDSNAYFDDDTAECRQCPFGTLKNEHLATMGNQPCVCKEGTYDISGGHYMFCFEGRIVVDPLNEDAYLYQTVNSDIESGLTCTKCPPCMDCDSVLGTPRIKQGWALSELPEGSPTTVTETQAYTFTPTVSQDLALRPQMPADLSVLSCPYENACQGEVFGTGNKSQFLQNGIGPNCPKGYQGVLCAVCQDGYTRGPMGCELCKQGTLISYVVILVFLIVVTYIYRILEEKMHDVYYVETFKEVTCLLKGVARVILTTSQILGALPVNFDMIPVGVLEWVFYVFNVMAFDLFSMLGLSCIAGPTTYVTKFWVVVIAPGLCMASIFSYYWYKSTVKVDFENLTNVQTHHLKQEFDMIAEQGKDKNAMDVVGADDIKAICDDLGIEIPHTDIDEIFKDFKSNDRLKATKDRELNFYEFIDVCAESDQIFATRKDVDGSAIGKFSHIVHKFEFQRHKLDALHAFYLVIFLLFPAICQACFAAFRYRAIGMHPHHGAHAVVLDNHQPNYLQILDTDYSVDVDSDAFHTFQIGAALPLTILAPFGIPALAFVLLFSARKKILKGDKSVHKQFDMLIEDYKPEAYYWEIVELSRKVLLAGLIMFFYRGSQIQAAGAICVAFVFFAFHIHVKPYKLTVHNRIKALWDSVLFIALLGALVLQTQLRESLHTRIAYAIAYFVTIASVVMFALIVHAFGQIKNHHERRSTRDARTALAKRQTMAAIKVGEVLKTGKKNGKGPTGESLVSNPMFADGSGVADEIAQGREGWEQEIAQLEEMKEEITGDDSEKDRQVLQKRIDKIVEKKDAALAEDRASARGAWTQTSQHADR